METLAIAYVLNSKLKQIDSLSPEMVSEKERLQEDVACLQDLYSQALENY